MSDKAQNPTLEFSINKPLTLEVVKMFKQGENKYGPWYGWEFKLDGKAFVHFANEHFQKQMDGFKPGDKIIATKQEMKNKDTGKTYTEFIVRPAIFDEKGNLEERKPDIVKDPDAREAWREARMLHMKEALFDASKVVQAFNEYVTTTDFEDHISPPPLAGEDMRAIAISFMIEEQRKR